MKKLLFATLFALLAVNANAQTITFATEPTYPPFENTDEKGQLVGFDIDIANAICAKLEAKCEFKNQPFDSLIQGLKTKRYDAAISAIDITPARAKQVTFSNPYYDSSASFVAAKEGVTLENAKNIGVQNGSTFQQYITAKAKQYSAKPYASLQNAILDLKNGRVDIIFGDTAVLADWIKNDPSVHFVGEKVMDPAYFGNGLGIAVNKKNQELVEKFNKALAEIKADGQYQAIYDKWMSGQ
ncbi:arginine ABC transporter substrate-binding protein [Mergibacter septicus]|uniref:arginine ABC transporter substrate-binding protein n=1 Tax=Mergibacter septicus TaxID=221402 RepID=UPI001C75631F|nr:arginine ABC transporter substrate-binding protein [Mergibacter septicus]QDJ13120.1 arginine ABC transporter substrate-binding protein [Mergibacter septicus]